MALSPLITLLPAKNGIAKVRPLLRSPNLAIIEILCHILKGWLLPISSVGPCTINRWSLWHYLPLRNSLPSVAFSVVGGVCPFDFRVCFPEIRTRFCFLLLRLFDNRGNIVIILLLPCDHFRIFDVSGRFSSLGLILRLILRCCFLTRIRSCWILTQRYSPLLPRLCMQVMPQ
jgi:hypothetical protein